MKNDNDQDQAEQHRGSNLLVLAGAGSGKTRTLVSRAVSLGNEYGFENLLVVTFTKKAAHTIVDRMSTASKAKAGGWKRAWIGTFHNICWRILSEYHPKAGLMDTWTVMDEDDASRVMRSACRGLALDHREVLRLHSYASNSMLSVAEVVSKYSKFSAFKDLDRLSEALERYKKICQKNSRLDYDGLLARTQQLLVNYPEIRQVYQTRFKAILVDEYQDTSAIQVAILKLLDSGENITAVGDDAQSIYSFRAANVRNILNFQRDFNARLVILATNYRNPPSVASLAEAVVRKNKNRSERTIRSASNVLSHPVILTGADQADEASQVLEKIKGLVNEGVRPSDIAVLYRSEKLAAPLIIALRRAEIPFKTSAQVDFFAQSHIKHTLNMCRLLLNSEDTIAISGLNDLLNLEAIERVAEAEEQAIAGGSFWSRLGAQSQLNELRSFLQSFKQPDKNEQSVEVTLDRVIRFLSPSMEKYANSSEVWRSWTDDLGILRSVAKQFLSLNDFLNTLLLQRVDEEQEETGVALSTIHAAKGLQWRNVFLIGLVEYWFPSNLSIRDSGDDEEERRLFYVACTRTLENLFLTTYRVQGSNDGREFNTKESRFLTESRRFI